MHKYKKGIEGVGFVSSLSISGNLLQRVCFEASTERKALPLNQAEMEAVLNRYGPITEKFEVVKL